MVIDHCNKRPQSVRHKAAWTPTFKKYLSQNLKLIKDKRFGWKGFLQDFEKKSLDLLKWDVAIGWYFKVLKGSCPVKPVTMCYL